MEIQITSENISSTELKRLLESALQLVNIDIALEIRKSVVKKRTIDPTVLVAAVGVIGTALGALITALLQVARQRASQKIVLVWSNGQSLEVPADMSSEELDNLIEKLKRSDDNIEKIFLSK